MKDFCLSRMNVTFLPDEKVAAWYASWQTNHSSGHTEMQYLPLTKDVKEEVSHKLAMGVTTETILDGIHINLMDLIAG